VKAVATESVEAIALNDHLRLIRTLSVTWTPRRLGGLIKPINRPNGAAGG
jgi:hypothetical protein